MKRKYFSIWAKNIVTGKKEKIDSTTNEADAFYLVSEYTIAFGKNFVIWCPQLKNFIFYGD